MNSIILFKKQCQNLRRKGLSLNQIVKIANRPKTSVYFHIKEISLSDKRKKEIVEASIKRIVQFGKYRREKSAEKCKTFYVWNKKMIFLIAHLLFDGELRNRACIYNNRSEALIKRFKTCMQEIYDCPMHKRVRENGVITISYYNVALEKYLKEKSEQLLNEIKTLPKELRRIFLIAFFDDEGCMDFKPNNKTRRVREYQHNDKILEIVRALLNDFDIDAKISYRFHEIIVYGRDNLEKFSREINFSSGVCVNGNRSNSGTVAE